MQRFGKKLVSQSSLLGKLSERSHGANDSRSSPSRHLYPRGTHPPEDTYLPVGIYTPAGWPFRQVRSTHEHMQVSMGTDERLSACTY